MLYSELSETAKTKAREWYVSGDYPYDEWWDSTYDWFKEVTAAMGFEVEDMRFKGFWSQGDGASWRGTWHPKEQMIAAVMDCTEDEKLRDIAIKLFHLQFTHGFKLRGDVAYLHNRYIHENAMEVALECEDREIDSDADATFLELTRELARWLYNQLEAEYEYLTSDEYVDEILDCNDYEFDENGEPE